MHYVCSVPSTRSATGIETDPIPSGGIRSDMDTMTGSTSDAVRSNAGDESMSETVVDAVADAKGVDPLDLEPLYDAIDPDALDSLFAEAPGASASPTELRFEMDGCEVVVRGGGTVVVTPASGAGVHVERARSHE